jgi:hypothetical protein
MIPSHVYIYVSLRHLVFYPWYYIYCMYESSYRRRYGRYHSLYLIPTTTTIYHHHHLCHSCQYSIRENIRWIGTTTLIRIVLIMNNQKKQQRQQYRHYLYGILVYGMHWDGYAIYQEYHNRPHSVHGGIYQPFWNHVEILLTQFASLYGGENSARALLDRGMSTYGSTIYPDGRQPQPKFLPPDLHDTACRLLFHHTNHHHRQ